MDPNKVHYKDMNYVFVSDYYDGPISGTCIHNNELHKFEAVYDSITEMHNEYYIIHPLTPWGKVKAKVRQWSFEICVGTHMSWNGNKRRSFYYIRSPKWLHKCLFYLYYRVKMKK